MLADKKFYHIYSKSDSHRPIEFCLLALGNSIKLDLGLGYFSSASFNVLSLGMAKFIVNNGRMNLYINKYISNDDYALLQGKYDGKFDEELVTSFANIKKTFDKRDEHFFQCLAYLIATCRVNIKIVVLTDGGLPHEKYGIFTDEVGNKIHFTGSMNLTAAAILNNLETVECTCSWKGNDSREKVLSLEQHFQKVWKGECEGVKIYEAKHFCNHIMTTYPNQDPENLLRKEQEFLATYYMETKSSLEDNPHFPFKYKDGARPLLSQQFFNIASKGMFSWVVLTDCYISNKYGQSVQSFFCAPITELCRVMSSFSAACSVSDTLTRFAKS